MNTEVNQVIGALMLEGFDYDDALDYILESSDYEVGLLYEEILDEVRGFGGHVDPESGKYTGMKSTHTARREIAQSYGLQRNKGYVPGSDRIGNKPKPGDDADVGYSERSKNRGDAYLKYRQSPLDKARDKANRLEADGDRKRANKIRARFVDRFPMRSPVAGYGIYPSEGRRK